MSKMSELSKLSLLGVWLAKHIRNDKNHHFTRTGNHHLILTQDHNLIQTQGSQPHTDTGTKHGVGHEETSNTVPDEETPDTVPDKEIHQTRCRTRKSTKHGVSPETPNTVSVQKTTKPGQSAAQTPNPGN